MKKIVLYDSLSYLRVQLETTKLRDFLMGCLNQTANPYDLRIWVWDGEGANKARRALFPAYKTRKKPKGTVIRDLNFVRELMAFTGSWQIRVPGFEGDDVIAALTEHFLATTNLPIEIVCRDADIAALCALSPRVTCTYDPKMPASDIRLYKTTVGDPSDTIPGLKGFGKGGWDECDKEGLRALITDLLDNRRPLTDDEVPRALAIGIRPGTCNWLKEQENIDELAVMRRIIEPLPVEQGLINTHLKQGVRDEATLHRLCSEYML